MNTISNYKVLEVISDNYNKGIYRCKNVVTNAQVVLKVLKSESVTHEEIIRFKREYKILNELCKNIQGVIKPFDIEEQNGLFIMVLEDIEGKSLEKIISDEKLELDILLKLALRIAEIIGKVHENKIINKDLKPSNIIWNKDKEDVKLIDFDISIKTDKEKREFQNSSILEGTLPYISPEQTGRINRSIDYRTDFYSFGVVLYEIFTGIKPHQCEDVIEQVYSVIAKDVISPYKITDGKIPKSLSDIIMKLIEKSPENRYRSIYGIKADLQKCIEGKKNFEIGKEDRLNMFRIPQKIYGRQKELKILKDTFKNSVKKNSQIMLVSGDAGVGKTALVNELHRYISREKGYFINGKYDQRNKNIPYNGIIKAFRKLINQLINSKEDNVSIIKERMKNLIGTNGRLITNIIPELERIIGKQPEIEHLNPSEEKNRFYMTFINFIKGITDNEKPLVIFLDDLQWADLSSLELLKKLITNRNLKKLFFICSHRDNESLRRYSFINTIEEIEKTKEVKKIFLKPLVQKDISNLINDTLYTGNDKIQNLSEIIYNRTKGNPFFINELLKDLYSKEFIYFDNRGGKWICEIDKIRETKVSVNVVEFLIKKIKELPLEVQEILKISSAIGNIFDFKILRLISNKDKREIVQLLVKAIDEEIIIPLDRNYNVLDNIALEDDESLSYFNTNLKFQHDRLQQALYIMINEENRNEFHLNIGRTILMNLSDKEVEKNIINIVTHINYGIGLLVEEEEINRTIVLNLKAAIKVKDAFGYNSAYMFLKVAKQLLDKDSWNENYSLTYVIYKLYAECAYLIHKVEDAEDACKELLCNINNKYEAAQIYEMKAEHYTYLGMMQKSIMAGILGLKKLGIKIPEKVSKSSVLKEFIKVKAKLRRKTTEQLLDAPELKEDKIKLIMRLLVNFIPPAFISGKQNLFALVVLKKVSLSLKYGNSPESAGAYIGYGILLSGFGDIKGAFKYGKLAIEINDKFNDLQWRGLVYVLYTLFCHAWNESWDTLQDWYERAIDFSLKSGDLLYLSHACYYVNLWNPTIDIESYLHQSDKYMTMIEDTKYEEALETARLAKQKFLNLSGKLNDKCLFDDEYFSEERYLKKLKEAKYYSGIAIYYLYKIELFFTYEKYEDALEYIDKGYKIISTLQGSTFMGQFSLYTFLNLAYNYNNLGYLEKIKAMKRMKKEYKRMSKWAKSCPQNFLHLKYLMQAESARILRSRKKAVKYYNLALDTIEKVNNIRHKALINELVAKFYYQENSKGIYDYFFSQSLYYYSVWGAREKINQLQKKYQDVFNIMNNLKYKVEKDSINSTESIDLNSILKASQAISKEIELNSLLKTLMEIVIKNAGAQRGYIIMRHNSTLLVEGEYKPKDDEIVVKKHNKVEFKKIPKTIIDYVEDKKESLIYNDAFYESQLGKDSYIEQHKPKSVLCMPLLNQGKVTAIIYLENNLVESAFTEERIKIINLLSREMVFALENASLYTELEQSEEKYRKLVSNMMDGVFIINNERFYYVNEALAQMVGHEVEEMIGKPFEKFIANEDLNKVNTYHRKRLKGEDVPNEYEFSMLHKDRTQKTFVILKVTIVNHLNNPTVQGTVKDITQRKMVEEKLRRHKEDLEVLVDERTNELKIKNEELNKHIGIVDKNVIVMRTDNEGIITNISEEFCRISGYTKEELIGKKYDVLKVPNTYEDNYQSMIVELQLGKTWKGELANKKKKGFIFWLDTIAEPIFGGDVIVGYTFISHNITDKKKIEKISITDEMTGLYNRRYFNDIFLREVSATKRGKGYLTFIMMDIDNFKKYNDTYGHYEGDEVLRKVGATIRNTARRECDYSFRLGGEEFGVLLWGTNYTQSLEFTEKLRKNIENLNIVHKNNTASEYVTISVGGIVVKGANINEDDIYKLADEALYTSKENGRNRVTLVES